MLKINNIMEIVFATGNRHKVEEAAQILGPEFRLRTPAELGINEDIPETSDTLEGNALQKAEYVYKKTGLPCFSDDTGLFVDALGGAPGVLSARYAGPGKKAEDNVRKLLSELKDVPAEQDGRRMRTARFRCVVAYVSGSGEKVFEGRVEGEIAAVPSGKDGFGYDPVFLPEKYGLQKTFAELTHEQKNAISHRGEAMRQFAEWMRREHLTGGGR